MNKIRMPYLVLAILIGIFFFIYGGIDDSPGGQLQTSLTGSILFESF